MNPQKNVIMIALLALVTGGTALVYAKDREKAATQASKVLYDLSALPEPVQQMLREIIVTAEAGDIDAMRPVLESNELKPMVAATHVDDPIAYWKKQSADGTGRDVLAAILNMLSSGFVRSGKRSTSINSRRRKRWNSIGPCRQRSRRPSGKAVITTITGSASLRAASGTISSNSCGRENPLDSPDQAFGSASPKRTGAPSAVPSSPSHIASRPRTTVPTGQPLNVCPVKGDQPHLLPSHASSTTRSALRSTMVRSAS